MRRPGPPAGAASADGRRRSHADPHRLRSRRADRNGRRAPVDRRRGADDRPWPAGPPGCRPRRDATIQCARDGHQRRDGLRAPDDHRTTLAGPRTAHRTTAADRQSAHRRTYARRPRDGSRATAARSPTIGCRRTNGRYPTDRRTTGGRRRAGRRKQDGHRRGDDRTQDGRCHDCDQHRIAHRTRGGRRWRAGRRTTGGWRRPSRCRSQDGHRRDCGHHRSAHRTRRGHWTRGHRSAGHRRRDDPHPRAAGSHTRDGPPRADRHRRTDGHDHGCDHHRTAHRTKAGHHRIADRTRAGHHRTADRTKNGHHQTADRTRTGHHQTADRTRAGHHQTADRTKAGHHGPRGLHRNAPRTTDGRRKGAPHRSGERRHQIADRTRNDRPTACRRKMSGHRIPGRVTSSPYCDRDRLSQTGRSMQGVHRRPDALHARTRHGRPSVGRHRRDRRSRPGEHRCHPARTVGSATSCPRGRLDRGSRHPTDAGHRMCPRHGCRCSSVCSPRRDRPPHRLIPRSAHRMAAREDRTQQSGRGRHCVLHGDRYARLCAHSTLSENRKSHPRRGGFS